MVSLALSQPRACATNVEGLRKELLRIELICWLQFYGKFVGEPGQFIVEVFFCNSGADSTAEIIDPISEFCLARRAT